MSPATFIKSAARATDFPADTGREAAFVGRSNSGKSTALNLLAGVSGVAAIPFLAASVLGYVPQTVVFGLAGAGASVSDGAQLGLAVALFAASVGLGVLLLRRRPVPA